MKIKSLSFYVMLLFLSCWVIGFVLFALYTFSLKYAEPQNAEAIVVLTGSSDRINTAFDLLQQNKAEKLFISGVNSKVSVGALFQKIDEDMVNRIQLGYKADNTARWGDGNEYDLCIDTGKIGIEKAAELILQYIEYRK